MAAGGNKRTHQRTVVVTSFACECNVFNPEPRRLADFQILTGESYARNERQAGFVARLRATDPGLFRGVEVRFAVLYRGFTGGLIPDADFETMKGALRGHLRSLSHVDGVLLDLHGAMGVAGHGALGDAEAELAEVVRDVCNPDALVAASFDLHGNFSARLGRALDLVSAYKTMPHVDMEETKTKALAMLLTSIQAARAAPTRQRPCLVHLRVPVNISGDAVTTNDDGGLGRELYAWLAELEWRHRDAGLLDAAFFVGFSHADEARSSAAVVLTCADADSAEAMRPLAQSIGRWYWERRAMFREPTRVPSLPWGECVVEMRRALDDKATLFVADIGDSTSAGASGDVPFVCRRLLELEADSRAGVAADAGANAEAPTALIAGLVDAVAVALCTSAGAGSTLPTLTIGAAHALPHLAQYGAGCDPLTLTDVAVCALVNGGEWAIIQVSRRTTVVLQRRAWAFYNCSDLERLPPAFRPQNFDVAVFKTGVNIDDLAKLAAPPGSFQQIRCVLAADTPGANAFPLPPRRHVQPDTYEQWAARPALEWKAPLGNRLGSRGSVLRPEPTHRGVPWLCRVAVVATLMAALALALARKK